MIKKILAPLLLCVLLFAGCAKNPQYAVVQKADGSIVQSVFIPFSSAELANYGIGFEQSQEICKTMQDKFDVFFESRQASFESRLLKEAISKEDKEFLLASCPTNQNIVGVQSEDGITYSFGFANIVAYYYYTIDGSTIASVNKLLNEDTRVKEKHLFTTTYSSKGKTVFGVEYSLLGQNITLGEYIQQTCKTVLQNAKIKDEDIANIVPTKFTYIYGTSTKRLHSNADGVVYQDGLFLHIWEVDDSNFEKETMTYTKTANANVWYLSAIIACGVFVCAMLICGKITTNKKAKLPEKPKDMLM